jgi:hypothetical protein
VLKTSSTAVWHSKKRLLRAGWTYGEITGLMRADRGVSGGFLLIAIDSSTPAANVSYFYTDYFIVRALAGRLLINRLRRFCDLSDELRVALSQCVSSSVT